MSKCIQVREGYIVSHKVQLGGMQIAEGTQTKFLFSGLLLTRLSP